MLVVPRVFRAPEGPAAREVRRPHFVRRRASKPARALRSLRRPPHQWCLVADVRLGVSPRCPARPCRRPRASSGPCALRFLADLLCVVTNVVNRRCFCVDSRSVVTNAVNPTAFSLKIAVFGRRLTTFVTRVLARGFKLLRFDDVCNVVRPPALRPGPPDLPVVCVFWIGSSVLDRNGASG